MNALRRISLVALCLLAGVGALCAAVWGATAVGAIKPLVVISGSMEPQIMTGDLLIDLPVPAEDLQVGDVVTLPNTATGDLVTHRIETVTAVNGTDYLVTMKGDNNAYPDASEYTVSDTVWKPTIRLAGWGALLTNMTTPAVALPLLAGLLGLLGLSLLPRGEAVEQSSEPTETTASA